MDGCAPCPRGSAARIELAFPEESAPIPPAWRGLVALDLPRSRGAQVPTVWCLGVLLGPAAGDALLRLRSCHGPPMLRPCSGWRTPKRRSSAAGPWRGLAAPQPSWRRHCLTCGARPRWLEAVLRLTSGTLANGLTPTSRPRRPLERWAGAALAARLDEPAGHARAVRASATRARVHGARRRWCFLLVCSLSLSLLTVALPRFAVLGFSEQLRRGPCVQDTAALRFRREFNVIPPCPSAWRGAGTLECRVGRGRGRCRRVGGPPPSPSPRRV